MHERRIPRTTDAHHYFTYDTRAWGVPMKAPAFQWYPKDCDTDENVRAMDDREFGFYMRCLNHAWMNSGLPADLGELARVMSRPRSYVNRIWDRVGKCFIQTGDRLINAKQEELRMEQVQYRESKREAGAKGAAKRWVCHDSAIPSAIVLPIANDSSASASASATAKTTTTTPPTPSSEEGAQTKKSRGEKRTTEQIEKALGTERLGWFNRVWDVYPGHDGKRAGMDKFEHVVTSEGLFLKVLAGAERYAAKVKARPDTIVKYLQGWLTDERWNDEDQPSLALIPIGPKQNGLTYAERNAAVRDRLFEERITEKLNEIHQARS